MRNMVDEIIRSFNGHELKKFKFFIQKYDIASDRKDMKFIDQVRKNTPVIKKSNNAYRQIRKKLKTQLKQFALLENLQHDPTSEINSMIEMAKYLFRRNFYSDAWEYLFKAEQIAIEMEEYELLDSIYYIQLSYSSSISAPSTSLLTSIPVLLDKRDENVILAEKDGNANAAYALLMYEISELFSKKRTVHMDTLVKDILKKYGLENNIYNNPKIYSRVVNIVCWGLREQKEYVKLREYSMSSYDVMEQNKMLDKVPPDYLMELLFAIYSSAIETKDYNTCEKFIDLYKVNVERYKAQEDKYTHHFVREEIIRADLYMCINRNAEAQNILKSLYKKYLNSGATAKIYFLISANSVAVHFNSGEYNKCLKIVNDITQQDQNKLLKVAGLGIEVMFFTELYGIICYYEEEDADYAFYMLKKFRRKYAAMLSGDDLNRENLFIKIMIKILNDASYLKSKDFTSDHHKFIRMKEYVPGGKEYISLNAWLTSKHTGLSYYECFLQLVH